jgi:hypothetical protein
MKKLSLILAATFALAAFTVAQAQDSAAPAKKTAKKVKKAKKAKKAKKTADSAAAAK